MGPWTYVVTCPLYVVTKLTFHVSLYHWEIIVYTTSGDHVTHISNIVFHSNFRKCNIISTHVVQVHVL